MLRAYGDNVVVRPVELKSEEKKVGNIYLPEKASDECLWGKVVSVGFGRTLELGERAPVRVDIGQTILYIKLGVRQVWLDGEEFVVVPEGSILGVLKNGE